MLKSQEPFISLYLVVVYEMFKDNNKITFVNVDEIFQSVDGLLRPHTLRFQNISLIMELLGILSFFSFPMREGVCCSLVFLPLFFSLLHPLPFVDHVSSSFSISSYGFSELSLFEPFFESKDVEFIFLLAYTLF